MIVYFYNFCSQISKNRNLVVLFANEWSIRTLIEINEGLVLRETSFGGKDIKI